MTNKEIKELIDEFTGLDIASKSRNLEHIQARAIYYEMSYKHSTQIVKLENIGWEVNRGHDTVLNGFKVFKDFVTTDVNFSMRVKKIEDLIISKIPKKQVYLYDVINKQKTKIIHRRLKNAIIEIKELKDSYDHPIFEYLKKLRPEQLDYFYKKTIKDLAESQ